MVSANRTYRPTTPSRRNMTCSTFSELTKGKKPEKKLVKGKKRISAHGNTGRITVRFRGGAHKRKYRQIDFKRDKVDISAKVIAIEYDPNRSARIALLQYADGVKNYILAPDGLGVDDQVRSGEDVEVKPGNHMPIRLIPLGSEIHNIELRPKKGGQLVRSAGTVAQLMAREGKYANVRLSSGESRLIHIDCGATIGQVGNTSHGLIQIGKAGRSRWLGRRPHNRGVTMNPVDHPHGGGEGRTSGGRHPVSPWGQPTKGHRTRNNKRTDRMIVKRRK